MAKSRASGAGGGGLLRDGEVTQYIGRSGKTGEMTFDDRRIPDIYVMSGVSTQFEWDRDSGDYNIEPEEKKESHTLTLRSTQKWEKYGKSRTYVDISGSEFIGKAFFVNKKEDVDLNYYNAVKTPLGTLYYEIKHPSGTSFVHRDIEKSLSVGIKKIFSKKQ